MERRSTALTRVVITLLAAVFAFQVYRAAARPIGLKEAYLYDRFVRPTVRQVLASELPDRDVLYALLEKRSVGLFHVSPFAVRLPSLLFGILYLWSIWRMARKTLGSNWRFTIAVVVAGAIPLPWEWFSRADGTGAGLALLACATCLVCERRHLNLIGICLGLSVTSQVSFLIPALAMGGLILVHWRSWWEWLDRVAIPAVVVAVIVLVLPLTHAQAPETRLPDWTETQAEHLQSALGALRASSGAEPIGIGTIPAAEAVVNFYRAQYRLKTWGRAEWHQFDWEGDYNTSAAPGSYYLFPTSDSRWADVRHLIVVHRDGDFLVARAPM